MGTLLQDRLALVTGDRRLARAHHAHQIDVAAGSHAGILSGEGSPAKRKGRLGRPVIALRRAQRMLSDSLMTFGVMKTSSSVLLSFFSLCLKRKPT